MTDHVVVDVEIKTLIAPGAASWEDTDRLGISTAILYEYRTDSYRVYGPDSETLLRARLDAADRITGFNIWRFDFPVIWSLRGRAPVEHLQLKTNDLLLRIWTGLGLGTNFGPQHKGWSLDNVCKATLGYGKNGSGVHAPELFQKGRWAELVDYCLNDVKLERDLSDFVDRYGYVVGRDGRRVFVPPQERVDLRRW